MYSFPSWILLPIFLRRQFEPLLDRGGLAFIISPDDEVAGDAVSSWGSRRGGPGFEVPGLSFVAVDLGSGSIFETLRLGKPLIVVVNEDLMDNHQSELAEELADRKHLYYARPKTLQHIIADMKVESLIPYHPGDATPVAKLINRQLKTAKTSGGDIDDEKGQQNNTSCRFIAQNSMNFNSSPDVKGGCLQGGTWEGQ
ncbi:hypothetical protein J5N97_000685 [Dioscorea zingiberensis]|uniref:Glycosyl transferase family 28 C-terminal domain-containing protein n=1 Tax=Dioscorea zingiberensis TaxID=325984 RepID=A0A9D5H399_9LILI|nr:hypothetical protein J5N97_000685 [Dioscorea zingiberensis]